MIQRKQTIWLLLAAIAGILITQVPIFVTTLVGEAVKKFMVTDSIILFAVSILIAVLALLTIFLFKNRPLQMKLSMAGIFLSLALIGLEVWQIGEFGKGDLLSIGSQSPLKNSYYWGALLPIAMAIFFFLAAFNIRKDEKLVKSLNRFR